MTDIRYALRALARAPGFALAAVGTLALGIGATTAVFSLTHEVLFTPPPFALPERLAVIYTTSSRGAPRSASSYPDFQDYRRARAFQDMAAYSWVPLSAGESGFATGQMVTGNLFSLLGVPAAQGRVLLPDDDRRGAPRHVVVVSDAFWRKQLGASAALGTTIRLNGTPFTVVGIASPAFRGPTAGRGPDVWLPMSAGPLLGEGVGAIAAPNVFDDRGARWLSGIFGRLAPGVTIEQARAELAAISTRLAQADQDRGARGITVDPLPRRILPVGAEADVARFLFLLLAVVASTLVLASSNIANLLLARASARQREMGIRLAMGAGRARLIRQLLTESAVLALLGAAVGIVFALFALDLLGGFTLPGGLVLRDLQVGIDARLLIAALVTATGSALVFGLIPALQTTRSPLLVALRGDTTGASGGAMRRWLVSAQVALSLVLLVGSGLFLGTMRRALAFEPGFRADGVSVARFSLSLLRYPAEERRAFVERLLATVEGRPGISSATLGTLVPFQAGGHRGVRLTIAGYTPAEDESMRSDVVVVAPKYFETLGIPVLRGRGIDAADRAGGEPVVVISRIAAERWWPGRDPTTGTLQIGEQRYSVVGVAGDAAWEQFGERPTPYVFLAMAQAPPPAGSLTLAVRSTADPATTAASVRRDVRALDPDLGIMALAPLRDWVNDAIAPQRVAATLLTGFGLLAVVIAALGIYGVVSYYVARQTRALGVRIALGAPRGHVARLVARGVAGPVVAGLVVGLAVAWALAGFLRPLLFRTEPRDPLTLLVVTLGLVFVAGLATLGPTLRAARIAPMEALRHE